MPPTTSKESKYKKYLPKGYDQMPPARQRYEYNKVVLRFRATTPFKTKRGAR